MPIFFIQLSKKSIVPSSVSTLPSSGHYNICAQDSTLRVQLVHIGSWFFRYLDWYKFFPATPITCLHAHIWNIWGSSWSYEWTISLFTSLNWLGKRIFWFRNTSSGSNSVSIIVRFPWKWENVIRHRSKNTLLGPQTTGWGGVSKSEDPPAWSIQGSGLGDGLFGASWTASDVPNMGK